MKQLQLIIPILFLSLFCSAQVVVQVYDADTYKVYHNGKFEKIRLANVDAPGLNQYYGNLAKQAVSKLILEKEVVVHAYSKDWYGRSIAVVSVGGLRLDSLLLIDGLAWHSSYYSYNHSLSEFEEKARANKFGMWRCDHNVPPWIWQRLKKKEKRLREMCR